MMVRGHERAKRRHIADAALRAPDRPMRSEALHVGRKCRCWPPVFCAGLSRVTAASRQEIARELFDALQGLERGAQTDAVTPRQTSDRDPIGRRPPVLDVLDLLTEDQTEKGLLCVGQRIE